MKRILYHYFALLLISQCMFGQSPVRIRLAASTYAGQLRGVTATRTTGITITGTYSSNFRAHEFTVTTTGRYELWIDVTGTGTSYSKDALWSGSTGKVIIGANDTENAAQFVSVVDADGNDSLNASHIEDSTFALRKLTTAAYNFIGSGGSVTNNPDDISIKNVSGTDLAIKDEYFYAADTTAMKLLTRTGEGAIIHLVQLSGSNTGGGGPFVYRLATSYAIDHVTTFASGDPLYNWVRQDYINGKYIDPVWGGVIPDGTTDNFTTMNRAAQLAKNNGYTLRCGPGSFYWAGEIEIDLPHHSSMTIEGSNGGSNGNRDTRFMGELYIQSSAGIATTTIKNINFFRDTTSVSRADTAIQNLRIAPMTFYNCYFVGWNLGVEIDEGGQTAFYGCGLNRNVWGWEITGHSDGVAMYGGFAGQNDSGAVKWGYGQGGVIDNVEMSHQVMAIKLGTNSQVNIYGGRYENYDSTAFQLTGASVLNVFNSSFLKGTGSGILARGTGNNNLINFVNPQAADDFGTDSTIIIDDTQTTVTGRYDRKVSTVPQFLRVWDKSQSLKYPLEDSFGNGSSAATLPQDIDNRARIVNLHSRSSNPDHLVYTQTTNGDENNLRVVYLTRDHDNYVGTNVADSNDVYMIDERRVYDFSVPTITLQSSQKVTRDTVILDDYVTIYNNTPTIRAATDSLVSVHCHTINITGGQTMLVATIYHPNLTGNVNATVGWHVVFKARKNDY